MEESYDFRGRRPSAARADSPEIYAYNDRARSQSPSGSVYSDSGRVSLPWDDLQFRQSIRPLNPNAMRRRSPSPEIREAPKKIRAKGRGCNTCRLRRVRCSGERPACRRCVQGERHCIYRDPPRKAALVDKIHTLERDNVDSVTPGVTPSTIHQALPPMSLDRYASSSTPERPEISNQTVHSASNPSLPHPTQITQTLSEDIGLSELFPQSSMSDLGLTGNLTMSNLSRGLSMDLESAGFFSHSISSVGKDHSSYVFRASYVPYERSESPGCSPNIGFPAPLESARVSAMTGATQNFEAYRYSPLAPSEIRLLRLSPGHFDEPLFCALKSISIERVMDSVLSFQALSYAWGDSSAEYEIVVYDITKLAGSQEESEYTDNGNEKSVLRIRRNLHQALKRIRLEDDDIWLWVDAICIDQQDDTDKSHQIPKMPDIYSSAWNVIVWLGEDEDIVGHIDLAVHFMPYLLNLESLERVLQDGKPPERFFEAWTAFGWLLKRSWFCRRWVIQEIASAKKLSVRIQSHILSWVDFTDALNIYLHTLERVKRLSFRSLSYGNAPSPWNRFECTRASTLVDLSRRIFRKSADSRIQTRLHSLESLVLMTSSFEVSEVRDTVYALLFLANDPSKIHGSDMEQGRSHMALYSDYSRHPVDLFSDFVRYSLEKSYNLDIICRPWASWPCNHKSLPYQDRHLPGWIGVASFAQDDPQPRIQRSEILLGKTGRPIYNASYGIPMQATLHPNDPTKLLVKGLYLGRVGVPSSIMTAQKIKADALELLGWSAQPHDGFQDSIWKTLVADRDANGKPAPTWYWRACALALSKLHPYGELKFHELLAKSSQLDTMEEYLKRAQAVVDGRRAFVSVGYASIDADDDESTAFDIGLGPEDMEELDFVYILFGCNVPVILRRIVGTMGAFKFIGPYYMNGYMDGERFAGLSMDQIDKVAEDLELL